jgi:hypothetical protein
MNAKKNLRRILCVAGMLGAVLVADAWLPGGFLSGEAEARVGRPATPGSVAGVARRTTRRVVRRPARRSSSRAPSFSSVAGPITSRLAASTWW